MRNSTLLPRLDYLPYLPNDLLSRLISSLVNPQLPSCSLACFVTTATHQVEPVHDPHLSSSSVSGWTSSGPVFVQFLSSFRPVLSNENIQNGGGRREEGREGGEREKMGTATVTTYDT